ncbi:host specificity factor TipJ family phage tail protein [Polaromonas sp.]|uniref:host specificity factor TipJ family phage tail protein n=1 Tax=Polaromonas sp. TaxID=1869339 RepID=UPI0027313F02|nr:host specificity factor TipJ family phage tail protein [Polaromonas sp.]MDP1886637.1 host specificity factor TipJ family phage tail protein [Polaromonas sp.]
MSGMPVIDKAAGTSLVVTPHPITLQGQRLYHAEQALLLPGERLSTFLARHGVEPGQQWVVSLGGVEVQESHWHLVKPKHGHLIEARRVPEKQVLQIVAVVALAYFTFGMGGMAAGSFLGMSGAAGWLAAGAVYLAGSMVINKLLGPKPVAAKPAAALANNTNSPSYSLQAGKNRARQFEPMGLVLGQPYCVPDLAGQPYTFFANGEQYLWQLFHFGLNCGTIVDFRLGQTPLGNFQGLKIMLQGVDAGNTGMPILTSNVDSIAGALLEAPGGAGPYVMRTSSSDTIMLEVDIEASLYSVDGQTGAYISNTLQLSLEYRQDSAGAWLPFPVNGDMVVTLTNAASKPLRVTYQRTVTAGQHEVRLRKLTADQSTGSATNTVQWGGLKSYQLDTGNYKGQARVAVQLQATGQLNGAIDELNAICNAKAMPFWNGSAWVTATNRSNGLSNPGAQILLLARGIYDEDGKLIAGLGLPDDEIDIEGLKGFMVFCTNRGFKFDLFLQENMSIGDLIESIAAAGMGSRSEHTGKLGVIWFSDDQPVEGVLNMATMKTKTFSVDYNTQETADEIEFQYFDRERNNTWKSVRVLAPGVTTPQRTARQPLQGVTTEAHAAILARFSMGQNIYHRKTVNCDVDLEHVTFRRGTVMALSHDLTQWGYGGRVQAAVNNYGYLTLTLDDMVPAASPLGAVSRYIGLRIPGDPQYRIFPVEPFTGSTRTVTLASAWPGGVAVPGDAADNPAHDTIWIYDFKATPGQKLRVSDVGPQGNMDGAKVQLVPESAEFWDYVWNGAYTAPASGTLLTRAGPVVTRALITEQLARQGQTFYTELTLTFDVTGSFDKAELWGAVDGGVLQRLAETRTQSLSWRGGLRETWTLELRAYGATRVGSPYPLTYTVKGLSIKPPDITNLSISGAVLEWTAVSAVDLDGYIFRFHYGGNFDWGSAVPLHTGVIKSSPFDMMTRPGGVVTIMGKAVDTSGNESQASANIVINLGDPPVANVVETFDLQAMGFPGELTNCTLAGGVLYADATDSAYGTNDQSFYGADNDPAYELSSYAQMVYTTGELAVNSALAGSIMTLLLNAQGADFRIEYRLTGPGSAYGPDSDSAYGADANPFYDGPGSYIPWPGQIVVANDVYQFRITIGAGATQGQLSELAAVIDAPDIVEDLADVPISAAGTLIPYTKNFTAIKTVSTSLQVNLSGAETLETDKTVNLAPKAYAYNSAHVAVSGATADFTLKGY